MPLLLVASCSYSSKATSYLQLLATNSGCLQPSSDGLQPTSDLCSQFSSLSLYLPSFAGLMQSRRARDFRIDERGQGAESDKENTDLLGMFGEALRAAPRILVLKLQPPALREWSPDSNDLRFG